MTHRKSDADLLAAELQEGALDPKTAFEEQLLRSAKLDDPAPLRQQRAAARFDVHVSAARARSTTPWWLGGLGFAAALGVALILLRVRAPLELVPEAPKTSAAPAPVEKKPALPVCPKLVVGNGLSPLVDDMEDRNARILANDGRNGVWRVYHDPSGTTSPEGNSGYGTLHPSRIPGGGRGTSHYGIHVIGSRFNEWGVYIGADLASEGCYDASAYAGIEFWAKGNMRIKVSARMVDVVERRNGGLCDVDCYASHRAPVDLKEGFLCYQVLWKELAQEGPKTPIDFDPARLYSIDFTVDSADTPFDLWIDDVALIAREH